MDRTKFCFAACPPEVCDCGLYDEWVDYPCDVEPPYDEEEPNDTTHPTPTTEQPGPSTSNTAG